MAAGLKIQYLTMTTSIIVLHAITHDEFNKQILEKVVQLRKRTTKMLK